MKKKITAIFLAALTVITIISINTHNVQAAPSVTVIVDGRTVDFSDASAYIDENGRIQLPARYIGEALGAHVAWDEAAKRVTVSRRSLAWGDTIFTGTYIDFYIGSGVYYTRIGSDGKNTRLTMDTKAIIEQDRIYVPVRYIAEALGAEVNWNGSTRTVTITSETKTVGDFVIPKSYTDQAKRYDDGSKMSQFHLDLTTYLSGATSSENRIQTVCYILSQKLGQDTINKLSELMIDRKTLATTDEYRYQYEIIFDSKSGQYVQLVKFESNYWIDIYDKGYVPSL